MKKEIPTCLARNGFSILIASIILLIIGYFIMSFGDRTISIIILIVTYIILIPIALFIKKTKKSQNE